jgi:hypothetical protein
MIRTFLTALAVVIGLAAGAVKAKDRPFRLTGTATWDNIFAAFTPGGAAFAGKAQATHLGKVAQTGTLFLDPDLTHAVLNDKGEVLVPGTGDVTLTAANGDRLTFHYRGLLNLNTGEGTGTLEFTGGTGRFADAEGSGEFVAHIDLTRPGTPMTVTITGTIDY